MDARIHFPHPVSQAIARVLRSNIRPAHRSHSLSRLLAYALAMYQQVFGRDAELAVIADFLTAMAGSALGRDLEQQQTLTTVCCHVPKVTSLTASTGHRLLLQINQ